LGVRVLDLGKEVFADEAGLAILALATWAVLRVQGFGFRVQGFGFRVQGSRVLGY
jgi:hypothetical protein